MNVQSLYVNLPVTDVAKAKVFFGSLGFSFNPNFSNEQAVCMVVNAHINVMLLEQQFFASFTPLPVGDAKTSTPHFMSLSVASRDEVDALMTKALAAGGVEHSPAKDYGFMVQRGFFDLDGHAWEVFYMNEAEMAQS